MKNQKGITLIALVITIIVLLILAGISIAMLTGDNGLLTKSKEGAAASAVAGAKDEVSLIYQAVLADVLEARYTGKTAVDLVAKMKTEITDMTDEQKHGCSVVFDDSAKTVTVKYPSTGTADYTSVGTITATAGSEKLVWDK